ncbi:hypothetical protein VP01_346g9 [Puccinia sorghi]|uniref:Myb-like domain-containing protein n=1 Tax=Puccinia sorghi TaxID=27349 RepID=A0A0L6UXX0_9BASI|nr:hypothetical protein VP01_346g9 [Puccinia sorghi]
MKCRQRVDPAVIEAEKSINNFLNGLINPTTTTNKKPSQDKWQPEEDEQLSRAWLKASEENPAAMSSGPADQRTTVNDTFWNRVSDEFLRSSPGSRRPPRSIQQRWAKLHQSISQFGECYAEQEARLPEGTETERVMVEAMKQYKQRTEQSFVHYSCWTILRHSREWADHLNKPRMLLPLKRKLDHDHPCSLNPTQHHDLDPEPHPSSSSSSSTTTDKLPPKTPKLSSHQHLQLPVAPSHIQNEKRLALIADLVQAIKRKNDLLEDFNRLERETNHIKIMSQFNSNESELWFKLKQQEILNEFNLNILS